MNRISESVPLSMDIIVCPLKAYNNIGISVSGHEAAAGSELAHDSLACS